MDKVTLIDMIPAWSFLRKAGLMAVYIAMAPSLSRSALDPRVKPEDDLGLPHTRPRDKDPIQTRLYAAWGRSDTKPRDKDPL
jgi:hypothetical protein